MKILVAFVCLLIIFLVLFLDVLIAATCFSSPVHPSLLSLLADKVLLYLPGGTFFPCSPLFTVTAEGKPARVSSRTWDRPTEMFLR